MPLTLTKDMGMMTKSIRMIKLCSMCVVKTLSMTFKNFIDTGKFPYIWKKMISQYCNNNMNKHNTCSLGTCFNKITH